MASMEQMEPIAGEAKGGIQPPQLKQKDLQQRGLLSLSDSEGLAQLVFHLALLAFGGSLVLWAYDTGRWLWLLVFELLLGVTESFLFNGFHEMVHNTAFESRWLNTIFAHVLGFESFRGAKWFWCFHWTHHRFTNDPSKDPELSGGSVDLDDPTTSLYGYLQFISGYPFGFERVARMARMAFLQEVDPWVAEKPPNTQRAVRLEARCYLTGYCLLGLGGLCWPGSVGKRLVLLWLVPHCLGAGHLRLYQFAEHRACKMGSYTETNAWICARTTTTWWLYRKLAWQMPFHVEHHAWPNVPFHQLEAAHELARSAFAKSGIPSAPSGCQPDGEKGYLNLHWVMFKRMLENTFTKVKA
ncbi:unnamed protein product [Effrenium voratum]|uniref:Fatty acid desaturase domain-containing protein n=1 Tax=Effrenium voratum TaxID=2562239 RepID=A0AA36N013_9DINO|nr:unnamed protein product [Effrenium voratum]CAJ1420101.1 unnamed protein product [Effrenium voratum]